MSDAPYQAFTSRLVTWEATELTANGSTALASLDI